MAERAITFPYAGRITVDNEGYFKVFFTLTQFENVSAERARKIYIPDEERRGRGTARFAFPAEKLSLDNTQAGEVRITRPGGSDL